MYFKKVRVILTRDIPACGYYHFLNILWILAQNYTFYFMKKIAVLRLHINATTILRNHVVEINEHNCVMRYYPLLAETPFTEWKRCDAYLVEGYISFN
jgi:hypothetical protein